MIKSFLLLVLFLFTIVRLSSQDRTYTGTFEIMNQNSKQVIDVADADPRDGALINQFQRTHDPNQRWSLYYESPNYLHTYSIFSVNSDKVIANPGSSSQVGTQMQQLTYNEGRNQLFEITNVGDGSMYMKNVASGLYLGIQGSSKEDGAPLVQQTFTGQANQRWYFIPSDVPHQ